MKQLQQKIFIRGKINVLTGLHIGGSNTQMGIGGPDKLIIRNPITLIPIIPGSSLKGKMRALLELAKGKYSQGGQPGKSLGDTGEDPEITALFGNSASDNDERSHASRLIVRDAEMILPDDEIEEERWQQTDMYLSESKTEVTINRLTSIANPRTFERIPAGAKFRFEMVVNVVCEPEDTSNTARRLCQLLAEGMDLLQDDYLGGNGSRGYGKITFHCQPITIKDYTTSDRIEKEAPEEIQSLFKCFDA